MKVLITCSFLHVFLYLLERMADFWTSSMWQYLFLLICCHLKWLSVFGFPPQVSFLFFTHADSLISSVFYCRITSRIKFEVLPLPCEFLPGLNPVCFSSLLMNPTVVRTASVSPVSTASYVFAHTILFPQIFLLCSSPCYRPPHQFCLPGSGQVAASFREFSMTSLQAELGVILWAPLPHCIFLSDNAHHINIGIIICLRWGKYQVIGWLNCWWYQLLELSTHLCSQ